MQKNAKINKYLCDSPAVFKKNILNGFSYIFIVKKNLKKYPLPQFSR